MDIQNNSVIPNHHQPLQNSASKFGNRASHEATILPIDNSTVNLSDIKDVVKELKQVIDDSVLKKLFSGIFKEQKDSLLDAFNNNAAPIIGNNQNNTKPPQLDPEFGNNFQLSQSFTFEQSKFQSISLNIEFSDNSFSVDLSYSSEFTRQFSYNDLAQGLAVSGSEKKVEEFSFSLDVEFDSNLDEGQSTITSFELNASRFTSFEQSLRVETLIHDNGQNHVEAPDIVSSNPIPEREITVHDVVVDSLLNNRLVPEKNQLTSETVKNVSQPIEQLINKITFNYPKNDTASLLNKFDLADKPHKFGELRV